MPILPSASVEDLLRLAEEGADHRHWYASASAEVHAVADFADVSVAYLAACFAALSPRVHVSRNVRLTLVYLTTGRMESTLPVHVQAVGRVESLRLMAPAPGPSVQAYADYALGPKTGPFARAVAGDLDAIVLDVWMARAFDPEVDAAKTQGRFALRHYGARCRELVCKAAALLAWRNAEAQAAVWAGAYRRHFPGGNVPALSLSLNYLESA